MQEVAYVTEINTAIADRANSEADASQTNSLGVNTQEETWNKKLAEEVRAKRVKESEVVRDAALLESAATKVRTTEDSDHWNNYRTDQATAERDNTVDTADANQKKIAEIITTATAFEEGVTAEQNTYGSHIVTMATSYYSGSFIFQDNLWNGRCRRLCVDESHHSKRRYLRCRDCQSKLHADHRHHQC